MTYAAILERFWREVQGASDPSDAVVAYLRSDYLRHSGEGTTDRAGFGEILLELKQAFPDLTVTIADTVAANDRVAYRWQSTGTHSGPYLGVPPTHKRILAEGITISRFDTDGRIVEDWTSWNKVSVLHSLGIFPIS